MAEQGEQRRLAAIFSADMVGYSRLMEADERGTIARQKSHRTELFDGEIADHHGRIVKLMGDGMLVEFASVVDAVECAIEVQRGMSEREANVSEERRILYRIGINLGDIVTEDDDILGDGVNIAARLQETCEPGGVNISGKVHAEVAGKLDLAFEDLGEQAVKNLDKPVRTYRVVLEGGAAVAAPAAAKKPVRVRSPWLVPAAVAAVVVIAVIAVAAWQMNRDTDSQTAATSPNAAEETKAVSLPDMPEEAAKAVTRAISKNPKFTIPGNLSPIAIAGATTVDANEAKALFDRGVAFIDVRGNLWTLGHIPGAAHLFLKKNFNEQSLAAVVDKNEEAVFYCMGPT